MVWQVLAIAAIFTSCGIALRWGGRDERWAAAGFLVAVIASNILSQKSYGHTENGVLFVDAAVFAGLLVLALRSDRFWPMWAAAFQLIAILVHAASAVETGNFAWAYYIALIFWSYPVVIALAAGTWFEGRFRSDRSFRRTAS